MNTLNQSPLLSPKILYFFLNNLKLEKWKLCINKHSRNRPLFSFHLGRRPSSRHSFPQESSHLAVA